MNRQQTLRRCALVTTLLSPLAFAEPPTASPTAAPSTQELLDKVTALQARVEQLESERGDRKYDDKVIGDTAAALQADASQHSKLADLETFSAGYRADRGFVIQSERGDFLVHPWMAFQFRNDTTYREDGKSGGRSDTQNGFEVRRLKLGLDGNLFGPDLTYQFILSVDRHNGNLSLEDAWAKYKFGGTPLYVRAGQIRNPFDHEQIVFGPLLLTAERSLVNSLFAAGDGIVQGAAIGFDNDGPLRAELALTDGLRSLNTNFQEFPSIPAGGTAPTIPANWGVAGRVEYTLMGDWKNYNSFTAMNVRRPLLIVGAGADYTEAGDTRQLSHVVDAQFDSPAGLSLFAAYLGRYVAHNGAPPGTNGGSVGPAGPHTYDATVRAQAGYAFANHWEPYARYEFIRFDPSEALSGGHHQVHEITGGVNYYLYGQRARFTADVSFLPDGCPVGDDGSGVLPASEGSETGLRVQFQIIL